LTDSDSRLRGTIPHSLGALPGPTLVDSIFDLLERQIVEQQQLLSVAGPIVDGLDKFKFLGLRANKRTIHLRH
jgi:hypothetical protein